MPSIKQCSKCKKHFPKTKNHFYVRKDRTDGFYSHCKSCNTKRCNENRQKNPNIQNYIKDYREQPQNIESAQESRKRYWRENKEKLAERWKERYYSEPEFRLLNSLRSRLYMAVTGKGMKKSAKTMDLLDCSIEYLREHIESQFEEGMSWDNHSIHGWHIDHIRPCASFDLSKENSEENWKKNSKFNGKIIRRDKNAINFD
jgi:hypothetical protein